MIGAVEGNAACKAGPYVQNILGGWCMAAGLGGLHCADELKGNPGGYEAEEPEARPGGQKQSFSPKGS